MLTGIEKGIHNELRFTIWWGVGDLILTRGEEIDTYIYNKV